MSIRSGFTLALVGAAIVALLATTGCTKVIAAPAEAADNTVTTLGSGMVQAPPDQATMYFGVTKRSPNARAALSNASKTADAITLALAKQGIEKKDIQTRNLSVSPRWDNAGRKVTGYDASVQVAVTVRDIASLGDVIDAATNAGSRQTEGPIFSLSEDSDFETQAIEKAVADARKKAEAMAAAAGKTLGRVVRISDQRADELASPLLRMDGSYRVRSPGMQGYEAAVEPGQLDVNYNLTVVFELE